MTWYAVAALVAVGVVAAVVLPRRREAELTGFPWFWVFLPLLALAVAVTAARILAPETGFPPAGEPMQYLSNEQLWSFEDYNRATTIWMGLLAVGLTGTVWSWLGRRV